LKASMALGLLLATMALSYMAWILSGWFRGVDVPGWSATLAAVLLLGGVQLLSIGILGTYVASIFLEAKGRPNFIVRDTLGFDPPPAAFGGLLSATPNSELRTPNSFFLRPRGLMPVDLFGVPADYARIDSLARENGLFVIEDAAQSFGALYRGRRACGLSTVGCTSFFPAKPLGAYGDGGMCFTHDDGLAGGLRSIRVHGQGADKYENVRVGINGRLDTLQAAILLAKFEIFPEELTLRQRAAERYSRLLAHSSLVLPTVPEDCTSAWAQYSVLARDAVHRSSIRAALAEAGIPTAVYYPMPLHLQPALAFLGYAAGDFPVSEEISSRIFSLPMHPYLAEADQARVAQVIRDAG